MFVQLLGLLCAKNFHDDDYHIFFTHLGTNSDFKMPEGPELNIAAKLVNKGLYTDKRQFVMMFETT